MRHEQTAVFAAEGMAKATRGLGVAALTAGPGVTNGISAIAGAQANNSPVGVLGGRAPEMRWGSGSLQEIDHLPFVSPLVKSAETVKEPGRIRARLLDRLRRLDQRRDEGQVIDLLQRARAPAHLRRPPAEHADRRAVGLGAGDRADPVGHARARGQRRDARPPRRLGEALGGEGRGLLVADVDDLDPLLLAAVVDREQVPAGEREEVARRPATSGPSRRSAPRAPPSAEPIRASGYHRPARVAKCPGRDSNPQAP